jgi:hypothetical protein
MNAKLTLNVDREVIAQAKKYAADHGTSVSQLVEDLLSAVARPSPVVSETPVLNRLRGALRGVDESAHLRHLEDKYRA